VLGGLDDRLEKCRMSYVGRSLYPAYAGVPQDLVLVIMLAFEVFKNDVREG